MEPGRIGKLQIAVYAGLGLVLVLLGFEALAAPANDGAGGEGGGAVSLAAEPVGSGSPGASAGDVVVHVAGAVREPGVYRLAAGARVADAIERAGGAEASADADAINLAAMLADGQQVVVPSKAPGGGTSAVAGAAAEDGPISLGTATEADLETIDGIGPVTAAEIIEYRDSRGGVGSVSQLDEIPGIGPATIESLSERLQP